MADRLVPTPPTWKNHTGSLTECRQTDKHLQVYKCVFDSTCIPTTCFTVIRNFTFWTFSDSRRPFLKRSDRPWPKNILIYICRWKFQLISSVCVFLYSRKHTWLSMTVQAPGTLSWPRIQLWMASADWARLTWWKKTCLSKHAQIQFQISSWTFLGIGGSMSAGWRTCTNTMPENTLWMKSSIFFFYPLPTCRIEVTDQVSALFFKINSEEHDQTVNSHTAQSFQVLIYWACFMSVIV